MSENVLKHVEANQTVKLKQFVIITWAILGIFMNQFLRRNHEILLGVLSTIKLPTYYSRYEKCLKRLKIENPT